MTLSTGPTYRPNGPPKISRDGLSITIIAMECATKLVKLLADKTGKRWIITIRKAEYLDFQLLVRLTHWQVIAPYGDHTTTDADLDRWSDGIVSLWKHDMREMA